MIHSIIEHLPVAIVTAFISYGWGYITGLNRRDNKNKRRTLQQKRAQMLKRF